MKTIAPITAIVTLLLMAFLPVTTAGAAFPTTRGHDLLVLRSGNGYGAALSAQRVGVAFSATTLPLGLLTRDGRRLYAALACGDCASTVEEIDPASGIVLRSVKAPGYFSTQTGSYPETPPPGASLQGATAQTHMPGVAPRVPRTSRPVGAAPLLDPSQAWAALSFNGRWLALREATLNGDPGTSAVIIDTAAMRVAVRLNLDASFGLDAISADGASLYLIEALAGHGPKAYQVRLYDVRHARLWPTPLREPGPDGIIIRGTAYTRAWSPSGDWLYTLYVAPGRDGAFIHALGVATHQVKCIMIDQHGSAAALAHDAMAIAPDGRTLYLVNPVLGQAMALRGPLPLGHREWRALPVRASSWIGTSSAAAVSHDGRTVFVATARGVWVVDTRTLALRATDLDGHNIASLALSADSRRLYALQSASDRISAVDPTSGRVVSSTATTGHDWSIEQVVTVS